MSLAPLFAASPAIVLHAFAAMGAFALGVAQLLLPKGTGPHRLMGWTWVTLMLVVAGSSFWIREIRLFGPWSPIHLLSILTLLMLPAGIYFARRNRIRGHVMTMVGLFTGALVIAGLFTFVPGRIMHAVAFGR
jgi:uncharacterized membrane protein